MSIERPYYVLLGVQPTASRAEITAAYRKLARELHPDVGGNPDLFIKVTAAYNALSDAKKRDEYDMTGDLVDWNPLTFQAKMIETLAETFEEAVGVVGELGVPLDSIDFMTKFRELLVQVVNQQEAELYKIQRRQRDMLRLRKRISRRGEAKNVFIEIIDKRVKENEKKIHDLDRELQVRRRCVEEASYYRDTGAMVLAMQAAAYPGQAEGQPRRIEGPKQSFPFTKSAGWS